MWPEESTAAVAARDEGIRKISRLTWRIGAVGGACSLVLFAAFDHGSHRQQQQQYVIKPPGAGTIVIPGQPPAPASGPGQVTSGAS